MTVEADHRSALHSDLILLPLSNIRNTMFRTGFLTKLCVVLTGLLPQPTEHLRVQIISTSGEYQIKVASPKHKPWTAVLYRPVAAVYPKYRLVIHGGTGEPEILARNYDGKVIWRKKVGDGAYAPNDFCPGGEIVLCSLYDPPSGYTSMYVQNWPRGAKRQEYALLDIHTGRVKWIASESEIGCPLWTNGSVFASFHLDLSKRAIRNSEHLQIPLPVFLEQRDVRSRRLLRRIRIKGVPPALSKVDYGPKGRVTLHFKGEVNPFYEAYTVTPKQMNVTIFPRKGKPEPAKLSPIVYRNLDHERRRKR
jgi:hypothetical protein